MATPHDVDAIDAPRHLNSGNTWTAGAAKFLERHRALLLSLFLIVCFAFSWAGSRGKMLWYDELFTYHIAALPGIADVWRTLLTGFEPHPPVYYLLSHASMSLFGVSAAAARLPSMVAFCVIELCLFLIVERAYGDLLAWVAVMVPFATVCFQYSYEARPYVVVVACAALAFLAWQRIGVGDHDLAWMVLLAGALGIGVLSHYYGVTAGIPVCLGEVVYLADQRRFRKGVWFSFVAGYGLSILVLLPFYFSLRAHFVGNDFNPLVYWYWGDFASVYQVLFEGVLFLVLMIGIGTCVLLAWKGRQSAATPQALPPRGFSRVQMAAAILFALTPLTVEALTLVAKGGTAPRYAMAAVVGLCLLMVALLSAAERSLPGVTLAALASSAVLFCAQDGRILKRLRAPLAFDAPQVLSDARIPADLPIAVQDSLVHLRLMQYGGKALGARLYFLASPELAAKQIHNPVNDRALIGLNTVAPLHVVSFDQFIASHRRFILFRGPDPSENSGIAGWLTAELLERGAEMRLIVNSGDNSVFDVTLN